MATGKRRHSIEVFRLRLRETVNDGDDGESVGSGGGGSGSGSARSLLSLPEQEQVTHASPHDAGQLPSKEERHKLKKQQSRRKQRQEHPKQAERTVARQRRVHVEVNIDEDSEEEFAPGQEIKIDADSEVEEEEEEEEDIDGREPSERCKPRLLASMSSGADSSTRTMRCSLDAAEPPSTAGVEDVGEVRAIEAVAQLDENIDDTAEPGDMLAPEEPEPTTADADALVEPRATSVSSAAQPKDNIRESRRVVLVTRPSQRDIEMWTERATSTMVKSTGSSARPTPTSAQSRRWVLEYKPVVRHSGWLIKRGHGLRNFKRRLFCIVDNELIYHDTHDATEVRGRLDLSRKSTVQCMLHSGFKLQQGNYSMVLYAMDNHDRDVWIRKLQEHNVQLLPEGAKTAKLMKQHSDNADKGDPILFSGWLRKRGRMVKSTKRRWFELSNTTLSYFAHPQGGSRKGTIDISHARVSPVDTLKTGERHSFQICTPSRNLFLHADSQEERSLWLAALASIGEGGSNASQAGTTPSKPDANDFSMPTSATEIGRMCKCGAMDEGGAAVDGVCRRCMSSFISNTEDAMVDVAREVQLLLASPYSPEGCTSAAFLKEHTGRPVSNATVREFMNGLSDYLIHTRLKELQMLAGVAQPDSSSDSDSDDDGVKDHVRANPAHPQDAAVIGEITDNIQIIVYEQIEERVFFPLYRVILANVRVQTREDAKLLKGKIEILRSKSQAFFGISPDSMSSSKWYSACVKLREVDKVSLPYMKRAQLLAACKEIYAVFHTEHPTQPPMSADAFIPAFIYVLVHAHLRDPVALKELITFFDAGSQQGEIAYFVTCLEIALEYIRSLLTACTVVLSSNRKLGIEFSKHPEADVVVVHRLVPGEQAQQSGAINIGDVLVAVNGLPVTARLKLIVRQLWMRAPRSRVLKLSYGGRAHKWTDEKRIV
ncbi:Type I inositol 3 [Phytophthora cinnamomi]|uniref:Type I inositol 3 n=1 Tax=Phytophthora cinnamomi TaxID=4785 RepID=UPI00355A27B1|nr:Type I inositol 3 [Phytophthora cinnamomi]